MSAHARLGPSNHRWPNCPGSVREEAAYPDVAGAAAIDGTGSHLLLELCLQNSVRADAYESQVIGEGHEDAPMGWFVDKDRAIRVQMCLDYLVRRVDELKHEFGDDAVIAIESESLSNPGQRAGRDDWWGTVDITVTVTVDGKVMFIEVIDYKDGRMWVNVSGNSQLQSYLIGKVNVAAFDDRIGGRITIVQPKTRTPVRYEFIYSSDLIEVERGLVAAAAATDDPNAPLIPDDKLGKGHCHWCSHKTNCDALVQSLSKGIATMKETDMELFSSLETAVATLSEMPGEQLGRLADTKQAVEKIYEKIQVEIELRLVRGDDVPGWDMGEGRGSQVWAMEDDEVEKALRSRRFLKSQIFPSKLISPAQALKREGLTETQIKKMKEELIVFKAGAQRPVQVPRETQDPSVMFMDAVEPEVSFL